MVSRVRQMNGLLFVAALVIIACLGSAYANAHQKPKVYHADTAETVKYDWSLFGECALERTRTEGELVDREVMNVLLCKRLEPLPSKPPFSIPMNPADQESTVMFEGLEFKKCKLNSIIPEVPSDELICRLNTQRLPIGIPVIKSRIE